MEVATESYDNVREQRRKPLRHRWDVVSLLRERKSGFTLEQIAKYFETHRRPADQITDTVVFRARIKRLLDQLLAEEEIVLEGDIYTLNLALWDTEN